MVTTWHLAFIDKNNIYIRITVSSIHSHLVPNPTGRPRSLLHVFLPHTHITRKFPKFFAHRRVHESSQHLREEKMQDENDLPFCLDFPDWRECLEKCRNRPWSPTESLWSRTCYSFILVVFDFPALAVVKRVPRIYIFSLQHVLHYMVKYSRET